MAIFLAIFMLSNGWLEETTGTKVREALLNGVKEVAAPGVPGPLCVFGEKATSIIVGRSEANLYEPVIAVGFMGKGRVAAFGHTGYLDAQALRTADTELFLINAIRWVGQKANPKVALRRNNEVAKTLRANGLEAESLDTRDWLSALDNFDVVCVYPALLSDEEIRRLQEFVRKGKGLVAADLGWGWLQLNPGKDITEHPANRLLYPAGISWAEGMLDRTSQFGFSAEIEPPNLCHAGKALDSLLAFASKQVNLREEEIAQAVCSVSTAIRTLPLTDRKFLPKLRKWAASQNETFVPNPEKPVTADNPLARLAVTLQVHEAKHLHPGKIKAHPSAKFFPGEVPKTAPRVAKVIEIDAGVPDWHSTGLYAPAGETLTVRVPENVVGKRLAVRVGAHSDTLWHLPVWKRCPDICRTFPLDKRETKVASAFGGLIYILVPRGCQLGKIWVEIDGAVEAPFFVLGKTSLDDWHKIRNNPAPWAELATDRVVLTVPSEVVRDLDNPVELMGFWNEVLDACAELAAMPQKRERPERIVADIQIGAGYMHSGYPIMTHLDAAKVMVDLACLATNSHGAVWGLFHEIGHNHQSPDWTFEGTGEVTVNLFTLYVLDKVCGIPPERTREELSREGRADAIRRYFGAGAKFDGWKRDPFLALIMYVQVQESFGWGAFKRVFAEYRKLKPQERPRTDDEKRDQWLIRLSRTVGRNLSRFFEVWGVPVSEQAKTAVGDLPIWMPEDFPPKFEP
ncbi:MAG: M60 family metallopeptidase [Armatimonadota bacterium]|nr:M60 family metallopeptidase [Armatimonadota bacterium]MDW8143698.1 M60 family metallopeptidase [Armatimonadota bacterium]